MGIQLPSSFFLLTSVKEILSLKLLKDLQQKKRVNAKQLNYKKLVLVKTIFGLLLQLYVIH
ncbi:hypothetical protein WA1_05265 [Scytonema hofmannii PCC 7110]|uniref:Uncharacterized protein n=1 Tax=Scytonema hofmannii PCC 7110 TaxID=128403 RepID=A0A139WZP1_9CYAN|nr:hypothetical protein WA1_05265 [Scytonema hofmannii PCC 7110]